jgi:hypothetical protein
LGKRGREYNFFCVCVSLLPKSFPLRTVLPKSIERNIEKRKKGGKREREKVGGAAEGPRG